MKIALCLSGQPRGLKKAYEYVNKSLLSQYDVDVFAHTWIIDDPVKIDVCHELITFIDENYQPKMRRAELERSPDHTYKYHRILNARHPAHFTHSFYYSLYTANELRILYEQQHGVVYDWVVRSRFDLALNFIIPFETLESDKLYVPDDRMVPERDFCNDQFAYGAPDVINRYSETYRHIDEYYSQGYAMNGEDMLQANLRRTGLTGDKLVYVSMNNPFPPGLYNGNWHSLVRDDMEFWKGKELFFSEQQFYI